MSHVALGVNGELRSIWLAKALLGWVAPSGRYGLVLAAAVHTEWREWMVTVWRGSARMMLTVGGGVD